MVDTKDPDKTRSASTQRKKSILCVHQHNWLNLTFARPYVAPCVVLCLAIAYYYGFKPSFSHQSGSPSAPLYVRVYQSIALLFTLIAASPSPSMALLSEEYGVQRKTSLWRYPFCLVSRLCVLTSVLQISASRVPVVLTNTVRFLTRGFSYLD